MKMKQKTTNKFWKFINNADSTAELELYGEISQSSWWGDEVTPKHFSDDLKALGDVDEITVRINSGGGDVFAAFGIYTRLKDCKARIVAKIDGWAASAATIIAMAADEIQIPAAAVFMIHNVKVGLCDYYEASELEKMQEELKTIKQSIVNAYAEKTGKSEDEISQLMDNETWYDGKQAVESGFCDKLMFDNVQTSIDNASRVFVNSVAINLDNFKSIPTTILSRQPTNGGLNINNKKTEKENHKMDIKNATELEAAYPELVAEIKNTAISAERKRIKDIEEIAVDGFNEVVNAAKFEKPIAASELAMQIIAESKKQGSTFLANRKDDAENGNVNSVTGGASGARGTENGGTENKYHTAIDRVFSKK